MAWGASGGTLLTPMIERLAAGDSALTSLHILRFRRLNDQDVAALCDALRGNTALKELSCSSHALSMASIERLGAMLSANAGLAHVSIGTSAFGDEAMALLAPGLAANSSITSLDCASKGLGAASGASLADVLRGQPTLTELHLNNNALGDQGLAAIARAPWHRLRRLELRECGLGAPGARELAAAPSLSTLRCLDLTGNALGPDAGTSLGRLVEAAVQLQELRLGSTGLGDEGVRALAAPLGATAQLTTLDLSSCGVGAAGCDGVAGAVARGAPLATLLLSFNSGVGGAGVARLAAAMSGGEGEGRASSDGGAPSTERSGVGAAPALPAGEGGAVLANGTAERARTAPQRGAGWDLDLSGVALQAEAVRALAGVPALRSLTLLGSSLHGAPAAALAAALQMPGSFPALVDLNVAACDLQLPELAGLLEPLLTAAPTGAAPQLATLVVASNPAVQSDGFEEAVDELRRWRPGLDVHWRGGAGSGG